MIHEGFMDDNKWASVSAVDLPFSNSLDQNMDEEPIDFTNPHFESEESPARRGTSGPRMPQAHKLPMYGAVSKTPPASFAIQQCSAVCGSFPALILPGRATASVISPSRHISRSRQRRRSNSGSYVYPPVNSTVAVDDGGLSAPYTTGSSPPPQSPSSTVSLSPVGTTNVTSFNGVTTMNNASASSANGSRRSIRRAEATIRRSASAERRGRDDFGDLSPIPVKSPRSKSPSVSIPYLKSTSPCRVQAQSVPTSPVMSGLSGPSPPDFAYAKPPIKQETPSASRTVRRSQSMRQIATPPSATPPSIASPGVTFSLPQPSQSIVNPASALTPYISLVRQPPKHTVYMRILKPYPTVALTIPQDSAMAKNQQLFVEASLVRSDNGEDVTSCLEGTRVVQVVNTFAIFKKLKITVTSQQKSTSFCLRFSLRRYTSTECQMLSESVVTSTPIVVYSHTGYLTQAGGNDPSGKVLRSPSPRIQERHVGPIAETILVTEVIPSLAQFGSRVVIIGSNFKPSPRLSVSFNEMIVKPTFHDECALVCNVPPISIQNVDSLGRIKVDVRVSLDGTKFSKSATVMHLSGPFIAPMTTLSLDATAVPQK